MSEEAARQPRRPLRVASVLLLFAIAAAAGLVTGELLARWPAARNAVAQALGHGELVALIRGVGFYGNDDTDAQSLVVEENLRAAAKEVEVAGEQIDREMDTLRAQFANPDAFGQGLSAAGLTEASLREDVIENLRARHWIESQIAPELTVTEEECRVYYEENTAELVQPQRFRVSHLFLAAPDGSPPEVIAEKEKAIRALAARIAKKEPLAELAAEASEDEASKPNGGDLGYFAADRIPPEFIGEVTKLRVGQVSAPVRSHLGFHIVQLTDVKPSRALTFDEARAEIATKLLNAKRAVAIGQLAERLSVAEFVRPQQ